jgi:DNA-directed RNA polymerase specialized sigma24 family protein
VGTQRMDFAEFYREAKDDCVRAVLVSVGDRDTAQELVAEAFARAWASWRTVSGHPAPRAWVVRTVLNASVSEAKGRADRAALSRAPATAGRAGREAVVPGSGDNGSGNWSPGR